MMGHRSKAHAARRTARAQSAKELAGQQTRPEVRAYREQMASDEEAHARIAADRPAQEARLRAQRWERREDGADGLGAWDHRARGLRLLHSVGRELDGQLWGHVSVSRRDMALPSWLDTRDAQWLLYPELVGVIVVAPEVKHVDMREVTHVWTRLTGDRPPVPDFTHGLGTI